jgi:uncharacterized protein (DUF433 family)
MTPRTMGTAIAERRSDDSAGSPAGDGRELRSETRGGELYEYYPLGEHVVSAPEVCRGRPTFKYTRIEVAFILECLSAGESVEDLVADYGGRLSAEAIREAQHLSQEFPSMFPAVPSEPADPTG